MNKQAKSLSYAFDLKNTEGKITWFSEGILFEVRV